MSAPGQVRCNRLDQEADRKFELAVSTYRYKLQLHARKRAAADGRRVADVFDLRAVHAGAAADALEQLGVEVSGAETPETENARLRAELTHWKGLAAGVEILLARARADRDALLRLFLVPEEDEDKAQASGRPVLTGRWAIGGGTLFDPRHPLGTEYYPAREPAEAEVLGQLAAFLEAIDRET